MQEIEQLQLFQTRVRELEQTRLVKKGFKVNVTINWKVMRGMRWKTSRPNEDDLKSFLLTFRHFMAAKEPIFLNRIYNVCHKHLKSSQLKDYLAKSRKIWRDVHIKIDMQLIIDNKKITPEYATDLWINGYYFHNDPKKRAILEGLLPHTGMLVRNQFLEFLIEATRQVFYVDAIVTYGLQHNLFDFSNSIG